MTLTSWLRLGSYEILEPLGSGGIGEVYRARDHKLGRQVAIKVLPNENLKPDRLRRFEQEARAASALNHPNIVTIYDVGEHDGRPFIAMELIERSTRVQSREVEILAAGVVPQFFPDHARLVVAPPESGVEVTLRLASTGPLEHVLADSSGGLPALGKAVYRKVQL